MRSNRTRRIEGGRTLAALSAAWAASERAPSTFIGLLESLDAAPGEALEPTPGAASDIALAGDVTLAAGILTTPSPRDTPGQAAGSLPRTIGGTLPAVFGDTQ